MKKVLFQNAPCKFCGLIPKRPLGDKFCKECSSERQARAIAELGIEPVPQDWSGEYMLPSKKESW